MNEPEGHRYLEGAGLKGDQLSGLPLLGISGIGNLLAAIKTARYYGLAEDDVIFTVFTDSVDLYRSRLEELRRQRGDYTRTQAAQDHAGPLLHQRTDFFKELTYADRKAIHNLKYYTWVEQQGKSTDELNAQWDPEYWRVRLEDEAPYFDRLITEFNALTK